MTRRSPRPQPKSISVRIIVNGALRVAGPSDRIRGEHRAELREMCPRNAVLPGQPVFIPKRPEKPEEERAAGNHVAKAALQELARAGRVAVEADHLELAQHHSGSCAAKDREQREILHVKQAQRCGIHRHAELAEAEMAAERAKQRQKPAIGKQQKHDVESSSKAAFAKRGYREIRRICARACRTLRCNFRVGRFVRSSGTLFSKINLNPAGASLLRRVRRRNGPPANADGEGEFLGSFGGIMFAIRLLKFKVQGRRGPVRSGRGMSRASFALEVFKLERALMHARMQPLVPRAIGFHAPSKLALPSRVKGKVPLGWRPVLRGRGESFLSGTQRRIAEATQRCPCLLYRATLRASFDHRSVLRCGRFHTRCTRGDAESLARALREGRAFARMWRNE